MLLHLLITASTAAAAPLNPPPPWQQNSFWSAVSVSRLDLFLDGALDRINASLNTVERVLKTVLLELEPPAREPPLGLKDLSEADETDLMEDYDLLLEKIFLNDEDLIQVNYLDLDTEEEEENWGESWHYITDYQDGNIETNEI